MPRPGARRERDSLQHRCTGLHAHSHAGSHVDQRSWRSSVHRGFARHLSHGHSARADCGAGKRGGCGDIPAVGPGVSHNDGRVVCGRRRYPEGLTTVSDPTAFTHAASPAVAGSDTDLPRAAGASVAGRLTPPAELRTELPITAAVADLVARTRTDVMRIVFGSDPRLLVVMGPCSIHDAESAVAYARWLRPLQEHVADALLLVMRVYVEKPRTRTGWKGLVNDPRLDG